MSDVTEYFLNRSVSVGRYETLEISHSAFSKTYYVVRNARNGIVAEGIQYEYYPLEITNLGARPDLDSGFTISFGDLGEILPMEVDRIAQADAYSEKPKVIYRSYRSDDLTKPLIGPIELEASNFSFKQEGATFDAKAPALNINRTGEIYSFTNFPMLAGISAS